MLPDIHKNTDVIVLLIISSLGDRQELLPSESIEPSPEAFPHQWRPPRYGRVIVARADGRRIEADLVKVVEQAFELARLYGDFTHGESVVRSCPGRLLRLL